MGRRRHDEKTNNHCGQRSSAVVIRPLLVIFKSTTFILPKPAVEVRLLSSVAHTVVPAPSAGHLPDYAPGHYPVDDGAEDLTARHPAGRAAEVRGEELPGPG